VAWYASIWCPRETLASETNLTKHCFTRKYNLSPGLRSRIPNNTGSRSQIFCPTPKVQLDHFVHHTPELGFPVEIV